MQYTTYYGTTQSLPVRDDTSPMDDLSYEEAILEYIEDRHIREYALLDDEQIVTAQQRGAYALTNDSTESFQTVNTASFTIEEAGEQPDQLPIILAEMAKFAQGRARRQEERLALAEFVAIIAINIREVLPLEDRPRRLFVEGTVDAIGNEDSSLLDGILNDVLGLHGVAVE